MCQRLVVGHQDQRGAGFGVHGEHQVDDLRAGGGVEVAGRLVGQQQLRPAWRRRAPAPRAAARRRKDASGNAPSRSPRPTRASIACAVARAHRRGRPVPAAAWCFPARSAPAAAGRTGRRSRAAAAQFAARASSSSAARSCPPSRTGAGRSAGRGPPSVPAGSICRNRRRRQWPPPRRRHGEGNLVQNRERAVAAGHDLAQCCHVDHRFRHPPSPPCSRSFRLLSVAALTALPSGGHGGRKAHPGLRRQPFRRLSASPSARAGRPCSDSA
jgi:hypothetical protein